MITLKNVEKCYKLKGGFYYVLQQINFTIEQGDFVSIMGQSGARQIDAAAHPWFARCELGGRISFVGSYSAYIAS
jgi:ABC-type uncharacterized transport system YnjBCD ATPase subunit